MESRRRSAPKAPEINASRLWSGGEVVKPWKCEEGQSICCNPRMKESYFLRCPSSPDTIQVPACRGVARECWKIKAAPRHSSKGRW